MAQGRSMTKTSPILLCPTVALRTLPDQERDVLRRFFTEHVRGMDRKHDSRWRRFVRDLFNAEPGEGFQLYRAEERGGPFHKMHRAVLTRLFDSQDRYTDEDVLHDWLKLKCWFVTWGEGPRGTPIPIPRSTKFSECSEDDIREFHKKMEALLHEPATQRRFWPHLKAPARQEMLETILNAKEQQQ
jgi:hypothetical protein